MTLSTVELEAAINEFVLAELDNHAPSNQFINELIEAFESDMRELVKRLDAAVKLEDWSEISKIRHAMLGTAQNFGALVIIGFADKLHTLAQMPLTERIKRIEELRAHVATALQAMRAFVVMRENQHRNPA